MHLPRTVVPSWPMAILLLATALSTGCARNTYVATKGLAGEGFAIWYPAESGIEPGQIWLYDGTLRAMFADRPKNLPLSTAKPDHPSIEGLNDAAGTLKTTFTEATISKAGVFAAELNAGTVRSGTYRVGAVETAEIDLGNPLLHDARAKYGSGYAKALDMVASNTPGLVLIAAVEQVPCVHYTLYCDDPFKLINRLPRIRDMIHARIDTELLSDHEIRVTLTPPSGMLIIGVTPVRGERLSLTTAQARAAVAHDLLFAIKQSNAFQLPVPNIVAAPAEPIISSDDTDAQVVTKYRQATTPKTTPSGATTQSGSSSRVLMPTPESRPSQPKY